MSGQNVSYNLRPNKFVERHLFVELLQAMCSDDPEKWVYVSMGGPQLEDHKLVHQHLGFKNLVSIEDNDWVLERQKFNLSPSFVSCRKTSTGNFVTNFDSFYSENEGKKFAIWFDYSNPEERYEQLVEFKDMLERLAPGNILKITLNANPSTLGENRAGESHRISRERRFEKLSDQLQDYFDPNSFDADDITGAKLPFILAEAIRIAAVGATQNRVGIQPVLLGLFSYQDSDHLMVTAIVTTQDISEIDNLKTRIQARGWEYLPTNWSLLTKIDTPLLTLKERLHVDSVLFSGDLEIVHANLPFRLSEVDEKSLLILEQYQQHYRRYPNYLRVML